MPIQEIYSETADSASLSFGDTTKPGKLTVKGIVAYGDLSFDGKAGWLRIGAKPSIPPNLGKSTAATAAQAVTGSKTPPPTVTSGAPGSTGNPTISEPLTYNLVQSVLIDTTNSSVSVGGHTDGSIYIKNKLGKDIIVLSSADGKLALGGSGKGGDISIKNSSGIDTITLHGVDANLTVGSETTDGNIFIKSSNGTNSITLDGDSALLTLGGNNTNGDVVVKNSAGKNTMHLDGGNAILTVGGIGKAGLITLKNSNDIETIKMYGSSGDIEFLNADFAEEFDIYEDVINKVSPGMVMILDDMSRLIPCNKAYDSKVVGVIAGAGKYKPAIVMDKSGKSNRLPIAMVGKVYCMVDANICPVYVGDMLTTSNNEGYAMKVSNRQEAFGSVIGKALCTLTKGTAIIPVLVNLQ